MQVLNQASCNNCEEKTKKLICISKRKWLNKTEMVLSRISANNRNENKTFKKLKLLYHHIIVFHHYIEDKN
jgi:hypothetical protein